MLELKSKTVHKTKKGKETKVRHCVKQSQSQSFLEISLMKKKVLSSHEPQDHAYE